MYKQDEIFKVGTKNYLIRDIQEIFDARIKNIPDEEIEEPETV